MKIEIKHLLNPEYPSGIEKTIKTWKLFGIVIMSKTYNYPKTKEYDAVNISRA